MKIIDIKIDDIKEKTIWQVINCDSSNRLLIDRIVYDREENGVTLEVLYK